MTLPAATVQLVSELEVADEADGVELVSEREGAGGAEVIGLGSELVVATGAEEITTDDTEHDMHEPPKTRVRVRTYYLETLYSALDMDHEGTGYDKATEGRVSDARSRVETGMSERYE